VFFKVPKSRFGGFAKARFAMRFRPAKSGFLAPRRPGEAAGFRWKWQTVKDLLEMWRSGFASLLAGYFRRRAVWVRRLSY
jgi:hypothetical protein